jgi:hypothetical protein
MNERASGINHAHRAGIIEGKGMDGRLAEEKTQRIA